MEQFADAAKLNAPHWHCSQAPLPSSGLNRPGVQASQEPSAVVTALSPTLHDAAGLAAKQTSADVPPVLAVKGFVEKVSLHDLQACMAGSSWYLLTGQETQDAVSVAGLTWPNWPIGQAPPAHASGHTQQSAWD